MAIIFPHFLMAQAVPKRKMSRPINMPNIHTFGPSFSADGKMMVYYNTYTNDERPALHYTKMLPDGNWEVPVLVPNINIFNLNLINGHSLSHDGRFLYFTTRRAPSVGGFDIAFTEFKNGTWTTHTNIGAPVNTTANEGAPSLSPDGNTLYFMRCASMTNESCGDCELFKAERRSASMWHPATKLTVNGGKGSFPRIMPDGKTLIFRNDPSEERTIHYITKWENGKWTSPREISWLSEGRKEASVSIPAPGNVAYFSENTGRHHEVMMARIPEDFQPEPILVLQGQAEGFAAGKPDALLQVYDAFTRERVFSKRLTASDPSYFAILPTGKLYDFSVYPAAPGFMFQSALLDMRKGDKSILQIADLDLERIVPGNTLILPTIDFEKEGMALKSHSQLELLRLAQFVKENPTTRMEIQVHMKKYMESEVPVAGLTEMKYDTLWMETSLEMLEEPLEQSEEDEEDEEGDEEEEEGVLTGPKGKYKLYITYHNDKTQKQADYLLENLQKQGVNVSRLKAKGYSDDQFPLSHEEDETPDIVVILKFE